MGSTFDLALVTQKAEAGDAEAQLVVGDYTIPNTLETSKRNYDLAMDWYVRSFDAGYSLAAYRIAELHEEGKGACKNEAMV